MLGPIVSGPPAQPWREARQLGPRGEVGSDPRGRVKRGQWQQDGRAYPICEVPGCSRPSTSTDHVIPYSEGGTSAWVNLQALCGPHHQEKTLAESHRAAKLKAAARKVDA